ncbi:MAG: carboxymuconolactone decarboxylase family protein [Desulfobacterales bacterium]|nr:MAG: carboxymuconolactone decarboxylase family protein [Desulfobacterales bacterium]
MNTAKKENNISKLQGKGDIPQIVDYKVTMLIAAGAAMAANCEPCLNKVVPDLIEAGVAEADIRKAVEIGQFVKDKPAAIMKEAADALTGSNLSDPKNFEGCPAEALKPQPTIVCTSN